MPVNQTTITLADARNLADHNLPVPEDFYMDANGEVQWKPGREPEPCRFRWNGDDHTDCPRCGGTDIDPVQISRPTDPTKEDWLLHILWDHYPEMLPPWREVPLYIQQGLQQTARKIREAVSDGKQI